MPGDKIVVAVAGHLCRLQGAQEVGAYRLDLLAVGAALVFLKQRLRLPAVFQRVHIPVIADVAVAEHMVLLVEPDIRQLPVLVGVLVQRLLHQFTGNLFGAALVIPAVYDIDFVLPIAHNGDPILDIPSGAAESVRQREPLAAGVGHSEAVAQLAQLVLLNQDVCKREV